MNACTYSRETLLPFMKWIPLPTVIGNSALPKDIITLTAGKMGAPAGLLWPFLQIGAFLFGGFRFGDFCCHEAVKAAKVPILVLHGEDDRFVPAYMSEPMAESNPALVTRHTFPGAGHGMSYLVDTPRYQALTRAFLDDRLA